MINTIYSLSVKEHTCQKNDFAKGCHSKANRDQSERLFPEVLDTNYLSGPMVIKATMVNLGFAFVLAFLSHYASRVCHIICFLLK